MNIIKRLNFALISTLYILLIASVGLYIVHLMTPIISELAFYISPTITKDTANILAYILLFSVGTGIINVYSKELQIPMNKLKH